jgi:hypothetical protein
MTVVPGDPKPYVLKYERGPCFGTCPVFTFYLLADHTAVVHAKKYLMDTSGWYFTNPDQEAIVEILELIEPLEWWRPDLGDQPEIADLPASTLVYYHPSGLREISIQSRTDHELENVFSKLSHLVSESTWSPTSIRPLEKEMPARTDVIVQLKPGVDINEWMKKFSKFEIELVRRITPNQNYYLVRKKPDAGAENDFIMGIKWDPDVIDAQWEHSVTKRQ